MRLARSPGLIRAGVVIAAVLALEALCRFGVIAKTVMIPPSAMAASLWGLLLSGSLNDDIEVTLGAVVIAFALAVVGGFAGGVALHALPRLRRLLDPLLASYYAVPFFVLYPLFIVIFGMNIWPVVAIAFLFGVVAMVVNTMNGLDRIPRVLTKTARIHRMGRLSTALRIQLPAAAPSLFTGVKLAVAYAFIGVIASEFILSASGLGYRIGYAYNNFNNSEMYALMLLIIVLVTAVNMALHGAEQRFIRRRSR